MNNGNIAHKVFQGVLICGVLLSAQICLALDPNTLVQPAVSSEMRETASLMTAIFKVMGSLAVVVGLMLALIFLLKKSGFSKGLSQGGSLINVMESRMVAPKKYIAIVEIANKCVAIGITDNNITMLTDVDATLTETANFSSKSIKHTSFPGLLKKAANSMKAKTGPVEPRKESSNV